MKLARLRAGSNGRAAERFRFEKPVAHCGEFGSIGCGCEIAERGVRPGCVVISDPARDGRLNRTEFAGR